MLSEERRITSRELRSTLAICGGLCALAFLLSPFLPFASAIPLFICVLLIVAWKVPFRTGLVACAVATLSLDFFFTEPRHTLRVLSGEDVAALCSFLVLVLFTSALSHRYSKQNDALSNRENAQQALQQLAKRSIQLDWRGSVNDELCHAVRSCFGLQGVCLWNAAESRYACDGETAQGEEALRAALMAEQDFDLFRNDACIHILRSGVRAIGSMQLRGKLPDTATRGSLVSLVSLTLERTRALTSEVTAQSERMSEQLRASVLDGLAHSIKTPLTTIAVSTAGVVAIGGLNATQDRLIGQVQEQVQRISALTDRLLRTARLDSKLIVRRSEVNIPELIVSSITVTGAPERFSLSGIDVSLIGLTDPELLKMAVTQIAENAVKYSPAGSMVSVALTSHSSEALIKVHNIGSHIPRLESELVFKRFYRGQGFERRAPGTGLGLSVAKYAVEALGGQIQLESNETTGTTFTIQVPIERKNE